MVGRKGQRRSCPERGRPCSSQPLTGHISNGGFVGEGCQEQGGYFSGEACGPCKRVDEAKASWAGANVCCRRGRPVCSTRRSEDAGPAGRCPKSRSKGPRKTL